MDLLTSIALSTGLAAACGFRVFVPFLVMNLAHRTGYLPIADGFQWVGTDTALWIFAAATALEILGYFIPFIDNALDTIATPAAIGAGVVASASVLGDVSPTLQWTVATIAGGGIAGIVQGGTVTTRGASSAATGGLGNFLVAAGEALAAVGTTLLALALPLLTLALVVLLCVVGLRALLRRRQRRKAAG